MSQQTIDGFEEPTATDNEPASSETMNVEISFENFVGHLQKRMAQVFTALMTENAELRAQCEQLISDRNTALAKAEAVEALLAEMRQS